MGPGSGGREKGCIWGKKDQLQEINISFEWKSMKTVYSLVCAKHTINSLAVQLVKNPPGMQEISI